MGSGIYTAVSGAVAQSQALDVVANNVANAGTAGFRAERASFQEALGKATGQDQHFVGVKGGGTDQTAGRLVDTGNPLDLAIDGDGYFGVNTPQGPRYTRAGNFRLDQEGRIVTADGLAVRQKGGGQVTVPPDAAEISVSPDGTVSADGQVVGMIEVVRFTSGTLVREGASLYAPRGPLAVAGDPPQVVAGALEEGNFNVVRGMIDLVKVSRVYEALHRMIESYRQIDERTARDLGGPK
jgi:flagellar basal-body rod protein FlgF